MIAPRTFTRDDTEHDVEYVLKRDAEDEIRRLEEIIGDLREECRNLWMDRT